MKEMKIGFELEKKKIALADILPLRNVKDPHKSIRRFRMMVSSIKEAGLIEPLVVFPHKQVPGKYMLLDGHLRRLALMELERTEADCVISTDDECFTYNSRVSRLAPIQEHKMIVKAVANGVSPERIAASLNRRVSEIRASLTLLDGIHEEAAEMLKDKVMAPKAIRLLKKVKPVRQIEIVELMCSANNFTAGYAEALVLSSRQDQLENPDQPKEKEGLAPEEIARMEHEMEKLEQDLKAVEESYGENMLNLTLARGYIKKLLENAKVVRFLNSMHADILSEFEAIAAAETV